MLLKILDTWIFGEIWCQGWYVVSAIDAHTRLLLIYTLKGSLSTYGCAPPAVSVSVTIVPTQSIQATLLYCICFSSIEPMRNIG